jgi:sigma-E factor negative regulatory protein RseC
MEARRAGEHAGDGETGGKARHHGSGRGGVAQFEKRRGERAQHRQHCGKQVGQQAGSQQGCAACQSQSSCGVSGLGKFLGRNKPPVAIACDLAVLPGDSLVLNIAESDLLRAGLLAYLLPALLSVAGAIVATLAGLGDAAAAGAMLAGFAAGLGIARVFARAPRFHISRPTDSPTPGDPQ